MGKAVWLEPRRAQAIGPTDRYGARWEIEFFLNFQGDLPGAKRLPLSDKDRLASAGLTTLKRLRGTGEQRITIQHVNVTDGVRP